MKQEITAFRATQEMLKDMPDCWIRDKTLGGCSKRRPCLFIDTTTKDDKALDCGEDGEVDGLTLPHALIGECDETDMLVIHATINATCNYGRTLDTDRSR